MFAARRSGASWSRIAAEFGLSIRQCQNIYADRMAIDGDRTEGQDALDELISVLNQAVEDFAIIVRRSTHDGYRVSALRGLVETAVMRLQVLRAAGRAPRSLAGPTIAQEMQIVLREFAELLRRHDVSDDVLRDFLELAERAIGARRPALSVHGGVGVGQDEDASRARAQAAE